VDEALPEVAIAHIVDLEPDTSFSLRDYIFNAARGDRAQGEWDPMFTGGPSQGKICSMTEHAVEGRGPDDEREKYRPAEKLGRQFAFPDVYERARQEKDFFEYFAIAAQGNLIFRRSFEVFQRQTGKAPPSNDTQFLNRACAPEIAAAVVTALHGLSPSMACRFDRANGGQMPGQSTDGWIQAGNGPAKGPKAPAC
jgi:hypothetical protein